MEDLIIFAQIAVSLSVIYVWVFRFHNVIAEFKSFGLSDLTRNFVGASKTALATLLFAGIWFPQLNYIEIDLLSPLVFIPSIFMAFFMVAAQFFHFKIKNTFIKHLPSLVLLTLSLFIAYFSMP